VTTVASEIAVTIAGRGVGWGSGCLVSGLCQRIEGWLNNARAALAGEPAPANPTPAIRIYMAEGRAVAAARAGELRPGPSGYIFGTPAKYEFGSIAQENLAISTTTRKWARIDGYYELTGPIAKEFKLLGRVEPAPIAAPVWQGGGIEYVRSGVVPIEQLGQWHAIPWKAGQ
jgi:hypothetical protein